MAPVPRLHVPGHIAAGPLRLDGDAAKRLGAVMRLREGDEFLVFSGDGREWLATVQGVKRGVVLATVGAVVRQEAAPALVVELWCALVRPNRFDWAIEKATEAGADVIRPLVCEFNARAETASAMRQERWERIAVEASEQSGRLHLPVVTGPVTFGAALERLHAPIVIAHPGGVAWPQAKALLPARGTVVVAIGPEGGFSEREVAAAKTHGAIPLSLGANILRTETAALLAVGLLRASL